MKCLQVCDLINSHVSSAFVTSAESHASAKRHRIIALQSSRSCVTIWQNIFSSVFQIVRNVNVNLIFSQFNPYFNSVFQKQGSATLHFLQICLIWISFPASITRRIFYVLSFKNIKLKIRDRSKELFFLIIIYFVMCPVDDPCHSNEKWGWEVGSRIVY